MSDHYRFAYALTKTLQREKAFEWEKPPADWTRRVEAALKNDSPSHLIAAFNEPFAISAHQVQFDLENDDEETCTVALLPLCVRWGASECVRALVHAFLKVKRPDLVEDAINDTVAGVSQVQDDLEQAATGVADLSLGHALFLLRQSDKRLYPPPLVPRGNARLARMAVKKFVDVKFCSLGGRRSASRDVVSCVAKGDAGGLRVALGAVKSCEFYAEDDCGQFNKCVMNDSEMEFLLSTCLACEWPDCLRVAARWLLGIGEDEGARASNAAVVLRELSVRFNHLKMHVDAEARQAIVDAVAEYCDLDGETAAGTIRGVCGDLEPAVAEAATTATLISLSRHESAAISATVGVFSARPREVVRL